jgi:hypothetical protein
MQLFIQLSMLSLKQDFHVVVNQLSYSCPIAFDTAVHAALTQLPMQFFIKLSMQQSYSCPRSFHAAVLAAV